MVRHVVLVLGSCVVGLMNVLSMTLCVCCFSGFMYAYVSYLSDECPACLVLLTADRESFHALSQAKSKITEVSELPLGSRICFPH